MFGFGNRKEGDLYLSIFVVVQPDGDEFHGYCPGLTGLHVSGSTKDETLNNIKDAILAYLESLAAHGDPLPIGPFCKLEHPVPEVLEIPIGAMLHRLTVGWPSLQMSGIS